MAAGDVAVHARGWRAWTRLLVLVASSALGCVRDDSGPRADDPNRVDLGPTPTQVGVRPHALDGGSAQESPPCPATPGTWTSCPIDRRTAPSYAYPHDLVPTEDFSDVANEPWVNATAGNLAGHPLDGLVFIDFSVQTTGGPGYLCLDDGAYVACPDSLGLPRVDTFVTAVALEDFDGDGLSDLLVESVDLAGRTFNEVAADVFALGTDKTRGSVDHVLQVFSQTRGADGSEPLHWVERTEELGLKPIAASCIYTSIQAADLDADGRPEVVLGGLMCPPLALALTDGRFTRSYAVPATSFDAATSRSGIFFGPQDDDLNRMVYLVSSGRIGAANGAEYFDSGSTCWFGHGGDWGATICPDLGHSPMGLAQFDPDQNGLLDIASSDVRGGNLCTGNTSLEAMRCAPDSAKLIDREYTVRGSPYHAVSWSVGAWDQSLAFINGYEHALEPNYDGSVETDGAPIAFEDWPQQLQLYRTLDRGQTYERVHAPALDEDVQERGLVMADFNRDGCLDLLPLPVGYTDMRLLSNGTCDPGAQVLTLRDGAFPAYGVKVQLERPSGDGGPARHQAVVTASGSSDEGFGPPVISVSPDVTALDVVWTTGEHTHHERQAGRFADPLTPLSP